MNRRAMLTLIAAGVAAAVTGCADSPQNPASAPRSTSLDPTLLRAQPAPHSSRLLLPPPPPQARVHVPAGTLTALPGPGHSIALTVDDGANADVVAAYIQFAKDTGARFTFFVTGRFEAWTKHAAALRPLVESGQIQLGNHTWTHPDLTSLSDSEIAQELGHNKTFLRNTYGVDGAPYYRPPYGFHNQQVDRIAADLGYRMPTLWYGSLSDSGSIVKPYLLKCARKYLNAQAIVIGHANHPTVTHCYGELVDIINERRLSMVTLNDVLLPT